MAEDKEIILPSKCLSQMSEIVEIVLQFLPGRDLETSARVCVLWRDIVRRIRRSRRKFVSVMRSLQEGNYRPSIDFSKDIKSLAMEPQVALLFAASFSTSSERPLYIKEFSKQLKSNLENLPRRCCLIGCTSLWMDFIERDKILDDAALDDDGRKLSASKHLMLFIPCVDGIQSCGFRLPLRDKYKSIGGVSSFLPKMNTAVKLVIVFVHPVSLGKLTGFAVKVKKEYGEKTVIVGLYSDCALFHSTHVTYNEIVGLVFAGQLNSVSIVINGSNYIQMLENFHKDLGRLKASGFCAENAIGIIFSSATHLRILKRSGILKCQAFQQHFPGVPVVVIYGTAVYGCDTVELERTGMKSGGRDFLHTAASVLCMISFKS